MPPAPTRALRACRRNWRALYAIVAPVSLTEIRPSPLFNNLAKSECDPSALIRAKARKDFSRVPHLCAFCAQRWDSTKASILDFAKDQGPRTDDRRLHFLPKLSPLSLSTLCSSTPLL